MQLKSFGAGLTSLMITAAAPAFSQTSSLVDFVPSEAALCPQPDNIVSLINSSETSTFFKGRLPGRTLYATPQNRPPIRSELASAVSPFQQVWVLYPTSATATDNDRRMLIAWESDEAPAYKCAWVARDQLLPVTDGKWPQAQRVRDIRPTDNPIFAKFVATNTHLNAGEEIQLYDAPFSNVPLSSRALSPFQEYNIFAKEPSRNGATTPQTLVGITRGEDERPTILGWVPDNVLLPWFTRLAVGDNSHPIGRTCSLVTDGEPIDLMVGLSKPFRTVDDPKKPISRVVLRKNPVVAYEPEAFELKQLQYRSSDPSELKMTREVDRLLNKDAVLENVWSSVEKLTFVQPIGLDADVQNLLTEANATIERLDTVDVLIVIDSTKSMNDYLVPVEKALNAIELPSEGVNMRVGVVAYGDYSGIPTARDFTKLDMRWKSRMAALDTTARNLLSQRFDQIFDPMKDLPEPSSAALLRAMNEADWWDDAQAGSIRIVFHIGDRGDRAIGTDYQISTSNPKDKVSSRREFLTQDVVQALQTMADPTGAGLKIYMHSIRVRGDGVVTDTGFKDGAGIIKAGLGSNAAYTDLSRFNDQENVELITALSKTINESLRTVINAKNQDVLAVQCATDRFKCAEAERFREQSETGGLISIADLKSAKLENLLTRLKTVNFTTGRTECTAKDESFVGSDGRPYMGLWLALGPSELAELDYALASLCDANARGQSLVTQLKRTLVDTHLGGAQRNVSSRGDQDSTARFLPGWLLAPIFSLSDDDLTRFFDDLRPHRRLVDRVHTHICTSAELIDGVSNGRGLKQGAQPFFLNENPLDGFDPSVQERMRWNVDQDQSLVYYVPVEFLP